MIADGDLDAVRNDAGKWRWKYVTVHGAEYLGLKLWPSKAKAKADGTQWLHQQGRTQ